jgi:tetratricopeptide (TPR) repeat protein
MARSHAREMPKASSRAARPKRYPFAVLIALVGAAVVTPAHAQAPARSCDDWHAELVAAEGEIEVQRAGAVDWTPVAFGAVICLGDAVRVQGYSRATLRLPDLSLIRVDQHSTLTLAEPDDGVGSLLKLLRGVIHVISRDPRSLRFSTPHVNAGLKGTEFDIRVDDTEQRTDIAVLEGRVEVANAAGRIEVPSGFLATAHGGEMPSSTAIAEPIDLMRWAAYFPAILDGPLPDPAAEPPGSLANDPAWLASRAASRLERGDLEAAEADLDSASRRGARDPIVLALRAITALGHGDIAGARERASAATSVAPGSAPALIAQSYVQSADGDVAGALASALGALGSEPNNAIAWARRAELELGLGDSTTSFESAQRAIELAPSLGYAHSVLGFVALRRLDVDAAIDAFGHASALDQGAPLPQLGLALALIQRGDFVAGRQHLELAVALDPSSSIVRSYMGKTYDAEHRAKLPASQLELAKHFGPADPTPWLYDALVKLSRNQPVEALDDLLGATDRNDNRTPFQSRLAVDADLATRSTGTAHVLRELGFEQLATVQGWAATQTDPADYSAHRLLADVYATVPRHELARVSELLTSQLLQPLNLTPIQPQLAQIGSVRVDRAGPSELAYTEFSPLLTADGLRFEMSSVAGANNTFGDDLVLAGLHDKLSYSVGQFRYQSDGIRENNELDERIYNAFIQFSPNDRSSIQAELRSNDFEHGNLAILFDPSVHQETWQTDSANTLRIGGRRRLDNGDTIFGTLVYQQDSGTLTFAPTSLIPIPISAATSLYMHGADIQHIHSGPRWNVRSGLMSMRQTGVASSDPPILPPDQHARQDSAYSYADVAITPRLTLTAGAAADSVKDIYTDISKIDPKLGVTWTPNDALTLRAAAFKMLSYNFSTSKQNAQPRLEPIQVAGFDQFLFTSNGDTATVYGLGLDGRLSSAMFAGLELVQRDVEAQIVDASTGSPSVFRKPAQEKNARSYFYWAPRPSVSFSARYEVGDFVADEKSPYGFTEMKLRRLPLEARYFARSGFTAGLRVSHYHQEGAFASATDTFVPGEDTFWTTDAMLGYRLAKRRGLVSLNVDNVFDKDFRYQDIDPENPSVVPDRFAYLRFTLSF